MNICVCIKQVPDTNEIKVDPVTHTLVRKGVPSIVNPFDTYAQEVGVRLKEKLGLYEAVFKCNSSSSCSGIISGSFHQFIHRIFIGDWHKLSSHRIIR